MSDFRGLVISPPVETLPNGYVQVSSDLDPQYLRSNILLWDKLDLPDQNVIGFGLGPDADFLISAGVMQRTRSVANFSGDLHQVMSTAHINAFYKLDSEQPGHWSLSVRDGALSFPDSHLESGRGALVRLHNAVPVPNADASLVDILEFRERRRSELLALRHHLETVYQRVISAGDGALAWNTEVERLERAIADHMKSAKEARFRFRMSDINASLNLVQIGTAGAVAYSMGLPLLHGLMAGTAAAISVDISGALKSRAAIPTPFKYVSSFHKEIF